MGPAPINALETIRAKFMESQPQAKKVPDKRNHLSLVELQYALQLSNIPPMAWEPVATIYNESIQMERRWGDGRKAQNGPVDLDELLLAPANANASEEAGEWTYIFDWVHHLILFSQSVDGWQATNMVGAMRADKEWQARHAAAGIHGDPDTMQPSGQEVRRAKLFG